MQGLTGRVAEVLKDYIPDPACFRVAKQITEVVREELQRNDSQKEFSFFDRFGPGGDLWHPQMCQSDH